MDSGVSIWNGGGSPPFCIRKSKTVSSKGWVGKISVVDLFIHVRGVVPDGCNVYWALVVRDLGHKSLPMGC